MSEASSKYFTVFLENASAFLEMKAANLSRERKKHLSTTIHWLLIVMTQPGRVPEQQWAKTFDSALSLMMREDNPLILKHSLRLLIDYGLELSILTRDEVSASIAKANILYLPDSA